MRYAEIVHEAKAKPEPPSDGRVWYHGTTARFDEFQAQTDSHLGFHFGTPEQARHIIGAKPDGHLLRVHLDYRRPLRTIDAGDWSNPYQAWDAVNRALGGPKDWHLGDFFPVMIDPALSRQEKLGKIRERIEAAGYDSIIYRNRIEGRGDSVIVFRASQIRPVTG